LKVARGKPETSGVVDLELTLVNYKVLCAAYHVGDFNGVHCQRIVQSAKPIGDEIRPILVSKRECSCVEINIDKKLTKFKTL
jgi:hypothetical protein